MTAGTRAIRFQERGPSHWVLNLRLMSVSVHFVFLSFLLSDLLPLPLSVEQRREDKMEGGGPSPARSRISLGATDPIMRANHFLASRLFACITVPLQQRSALLLTLPAFPHNDEGQRETKTKDCSILHENNPSCRQVLSF